MKKFMQKISIVVLLSFIIFFSQNCSAGQMIIGGYWENWLGPLHPQGTDPNVSEYYSHDLKHFNHVYYSFLTLVQHPNPGNPPDEQWNGIAIYESMTATNVIAVMTKTDPEWKNPNNWQRKKIVAIIDYCHANNKKFIWAIGGWSDLKRTISDAQIPAFVSNCIDLLKIAGDGIDFDWEHLSEIAEIKEQQRHVLGKIFPALRNAMDENGLSDKLIGYTTRFNAFWGAGVPVPTNVTPFQSDGEGIDINDSLTNSGSSFADTVDWANIMMYDVPASNLGAPDNKFILDNYIQVLNYFETYVPKDKIVMGFEPGGQAAGGEWEGMDVDKQVIDYIKLNYYGGIMFWAVNQPASAGTTNVTGDNAQVLAGYALPEGITGILGVVFVLINRIRREINY